MNFDKCGSSITQHVAARAGGTQAPTQSLGIRATVSIDADARPTHVTHDSMENHARLVTRQDG